LCTVKNNPQKTRITMDDNTYYKQPVEDNSELPFDKFPFGYNKVTAIVLCVFLGIAMIEPFLPPRHGRKNWRPPQSFNDYLARLETFLIIMAVLLLLVVLVFLMPLVRTLIDRRLGYKKVGIFQVKRLKEIKGKKFAVLINGGSIPLGGKLPNVNNIEAGQRIEVERSATNKLVSFRVVT